MLTNLSIIIGTILSLGVVFQLVTNMLLATPVEYHLESNYQRLFRYAVHVITISFFLILLTLLAFLNSSEGEEFKNVEFNNIYFTGGYLLFLLVLFAICIYVPCRDIWKENYQRKLIFKKDNGKKYIILKKFLNNKVLLTPVETTKNTQYYIIKEDDLEKGLLELESYDTVADRRAMKYFIRWDNAPLNSKIMIIIIFILIVIILLITSLRLGTGIFKSVIGTTIIVVLCLMLYLREYIKGKKLMKSE